MKKTGVSEKTLTCTLKLIRISFVSSITSAGNVHLPLSDDQRPAYRFNCKGSLLKFIDIFISLHTVLN